MKSLLIVLMISLTAFGGEKSPDSRFIDAFPILPNDLELSRLAQPTQYFDKIGPHAGLMGIESGQFEMWVWPWKPLRNFELQFLLGTSTQPIYAKDIVRTISVTPELTTITYTFEAFTVREHIFIPRHEPGAIILLDVRTTTDLAIIPGFIPVMQPMWPAGIGGQFSYWDDEVRGYIISEGQWRAEFICGSPAGKPMAAPPAHMFADNPLQFRIDVKPGETDGKFIPIVIAGAMPDTTTWKMKMDSVKATYGRLCLNAEKYYRECHDYFVELRNSTLQIELRRKEWNLAFEWGKVALDNLMIVNPRLGYGMVAGFGLSGGGGRPGFAWFFGGDAFINVLTLNSVGMFRQARAALAFTQKWQRQENYPIRKKNPDDPPKDVGKMAHELSQSDGICDWWNDYRYGYNHADTSPWYLVAMGDYVRTSGDTAFLRESWKSVKQAYAWCLSKDSDGDGLMDLKGAGLGALEFGKLVGIYADVYTCGVWVQGIKEMKYMAELVGDDRQAVQSDSLFNIARPRLEKLFWLEKEGFYSYGATADGVQVREKTPWSGVAMMFGLLDEERTARSIEAFNSADLCTDWGVRTLSNKSPLFEPTNYNYGAVWPFISTFFNTAQFKHHYALSGYQILEATIQHAFDHGLGVVPEVFSGSLNEKLGEAYHHQGFSTTGYMLPLVRGMLGLQIDAIKRRVDIVPHLNTMIRGPVQIKGIQCCGGKLMAHMESGGGGITCTFENLAGEPIEVVLSPAFEAGSSIIRSELFPDQSFPEVEDYVLDVHSTMRFVVKARVDTFVRVESSFPEFFLSDHTAVLGSENEDLRVLSKKCVNDALHITVEGVRGKTYRRLALYRPAERFDVDGASFDNDTITIPFDGESGERLVRKEVVISPKHRK